MLTADYAVEYLCQKMGRDEKNYGIKWMDYDAGYAAMVKDVLLYLRAAHSPTGSFIVLTLVKDGKVTHIEEPKIHFSQAPIGKMITAIATLLGRPPLKAPTTPRQRENERLRVNLNRLFLRAAQQTDLYPQTGNKELKELLGRSRKVLHNGHYHYKETEYQEIIQELFRTLTMEQ